MTMPTCPLIQPLRAVASAARRVIAALGPYLLIELLLPGGTLFALLLYLWRRPRRPSIAAASHLPNPSTAAGMPPAALRYVAP